MIKTPLKILLAASIALPTMLAFSDANARHKKRNHHKAPHSSHVYKYPSSHYSGGYYGGHYGGNYYGGHRRHHGNTGTYVGLALLGLGLGYAISKSGDNDYERDEYREDYYQAPPRARYATPPQPQDYQGGETYSSQSFDFSQCQETREYQTAIFIDGQEQQAFGTACLMPDGS